LLNALKNEIDFSPPLFWFLLRWDRRVYRLRCRWRGRGLRICFRSMFCLCRFLWFGVVFCL